jgi:hypothetical protein
MIRFGETSAGAFVFRQFTFEELFKGSVLNPIILRPTDASPPPDTFRSLVLDNNLAHSSIFVFPNALLAGPPIGIIAPQRFRVWLLPELDVLALRLAQAPTGGADSGWINVTGGAFPLAPNEGAVD